MAYNFEIAKNVLSDTDKTRLLCLYLNCDPSSINWEKATKDFGAASVESMRVMTRTALKKIENAGGREGVEAAPAKTPTAPGGRGRKRKGTTADGEGETSSKKKPRGRKAKVEQSPASASVEEDVKVEKSEDSKTAKDAENAENAENAETAKENGDEDGKDDESDMAF